MEDDKFEEFEASFFESNYNYKILDEQKISEIKNELEDNKNKSEGYKENENKLQPHEISINRKLLHNPIQNLSLAYKSDIKSSEIIPLSIKIIYSLPSFGKMSCVVLLNIQGLLYYESIGAGLLYISFFVALARAFEIILKPLIAHWSDECTSKLGRRKPFMLFGCIFYAIFLILLFTPPGMRTGSLYISLWFGVFYVLFFIADTVCNVPYCALGPELSNDTKEREKLYIIFYAFQYIGVLFASAAPIVLNTFYAPCDCLLCRNNPLVTDINECVKQCEIFCNLKNNRTSLFYMSVFIGIFYIVTIFLVSYKVKEQKVSFKKEPIHFLPSLYKLLDNKPFLKLITPWIIDVMITTTFGTMLPFFLNFIINPQKYCLNNGIKLDSDQCSLNFWLATSITSFFITCIISMFIWHQLVKVYGKKRCWEVYSLISVLTFSLFLMCDEGSMGTLIFASICCGFPAGGAYLNDVFISDVIEYDEFLTGKRNEGLFTVFSAFIPKVVSIFAQAIPLTVMSRFVSSNNGLTMEQPRVVIEFIKFFFIALPCILALVSFYYKVKYPIDNDETLDEIRKAINMQKDFAEYLKYKCDYYKILDPVYKTYHIQIFALNKSQSDTKIIVDHFTDIKYLKLLYSMDFFILRSQVKFNIAGCVIVLIVFLTTLITTFTFLQNKALSLIPLLSLFIISFITIALVFNIMRFKVVNNMIDGKLKLDLKFLKLLILKTLHDDQEEILNENKLKIFNIVDEDNSVKYINKSLLDESTKNE